MKKEINTLFALLRCAVFGEKVGEYDKKEAAEKSPLLYAMARHHDLAHLLDYAYTISGISANDEEAAFKLVKQQAVAILRYENLNLALENVSALLVKEHIPFIPLKGAVIRKMYPEPWMRTSCDIDILVHEEDLERAEKAIVKKLGYTSKGKRGYHDISLYSDTDVHLELHFNIKENMDKIDTLLEKVWDYAKPESENSYKYVLSDEFFLFQHIAHLAYHVKSGGCSVRYFMDLHLLINKLSYDNEKVCEMLEMCGLDAFFSTCVKMCDVWFSDGEHDETTLLFQRYLLNGGMYGTKQNQIAASSDKKSMVAYVLNRVFMPYEQLCVTYPLLKGKKMLIPFYQIRRWLRIVANRRLDSASEEFKAKKHVSDSNFGDYSKLFETMKLN